MAWWALLVAGWLLLGVIGALLLAHRIGTADRRERALRARWADSRLGNDRFTG